MSTFQEGKIAPTATLASLINLIQADPTIPESRSREMVSAIRTVAKVLRLEPHMIPATPGDLRELINNALPTAVGVSGSRWSNAKSLLRKALALLDPKVIPARSRVGLLPAWRALLDEPSSTSLLRGIARFSKWCSAAGITPVEVTKATYDSFYEDLVAHCLVRSPRETQQTAGKAWNAASKIVSGWPKLTLDISNLRRNPSLPWDAFPASFRADVEAFVTPRGSKHFNLRETGARTRASTMNARRTTIRHFATAVVESGHSPAALKSLADLVQPDTAWSGLSVLVERAKGEKTGRNHLTAYLLITIAKHCVKADDAVIEELKAFADELNPRRRGMTDKNRKRLQQFDDPKLLGSLLDLPALLMAEATAVLKPSKVEARTAQLAVIIDILLMAPLRISNLSALEVGRTLMLGGGSVGHIVIGYQEVKNDQDIEIPLPAETLKRIDTYLKKFHPLLAPPGCRMLFPSQDRGHKRSTVMSHQISRCIRQRCGIALNAHLFRHLAAKMYLDAFPGAYGVVRMLLGHKLIQTTIDTYCGTEFKAAFRQYDAYIQKLRGSLGVPTQEARFVKAHR
jgi:integrase